MKSWQIAVLGMVIACASIVVNIAALWNADMWLTSGLVFLAAALSGVGGFAVTSSYSEDSAAATFWGLIFTALVVAFMDSLPGSAQLHFALILATVLTPIGGAISALGFNSLDTKPSRATTAGAV